MTDDPRLDDDFEEHRRHLFGVAYRMLGSVADAEDAVQEAWLRLRRSRESEAAEIENLGGWLTTTISRIALNMLRSRGIRRTDSLEERLEHLPEPILEREGGGDPGEEVALADTVGLALLIVLETLSPAERVAFVLHDLFAVPFDEVAAVLGRSPQAARQLASRARRRVQGRAPQTDADPAAQRAVVDAFFAAARDGDLPRLISLLDPEVVVHSDLGAGVLRSHGAQEVAASALRYAHPDRVVHPVLVNGAPGAAIARDGALFSIMAFTVADGRIVQIDAFAAPDLIGRLAGNPALPDPGSRPSR
ncbi:RNA polymerase sigma 70 [Brachybacterium phenoliresistens]|uniref:RNA polymerase sigma 70 n=1 Tax=Brachybacterium phenoliresistens TaxID=396014 RepID=Z9JMC5_9MICO|nr:sigma-70 family RNA polymerase sigma factor [Brachybacterium phenoliresistens]EWS79540.1 RNA polymerase sigma 70 [Brachybacterium phenoliresistens]